LISTGDFRRGSKIEYKGEPCEVVEFQHQKIGRGGALVKTKLRNLITGAILDDSFRSGEKFPKPELEEKQMQYLYEQDDMYYFMDNQSYEQVPFTKAMLGDAMRFIKENESASVLFYKGKPVSVEPPMFVELTVAETEPGFKGDTATGGSKPAVLETGAQVKVPFHINVGDRVKIDTRTAEYIERVK
jgi:elongation factor P